jgi:hypothetical protein
MVVLLNKVVYRQDWQGNVLAWGCPDSLVPFRADARHPREIA